jgi:hypothetical protein
MKCRDLILTFTIIEITKILMTIKQRIILRVLQLNVICSNMSPLKLVTRKLDLLLWIKNLS